MSNTKHEKMQKIVEDYWELFSKDYEEEDESYYYQITCRVLYEVNAWIERDNDKAAVVFSKLLELNVNQDYNVEYKESVIKMLKNNGLAATIEQTYLESAVTLSEVGYLEDIFIKKALSYVLKRVLEGNPEMLNSSIRYNTIVLSCAENQFITVKVSTSKNFCTSTYKADKLCCSWHKGRTSFIEACDYFVFVVQDGDGYRSLVFRNQDLIHHLSKKRSSSDFMSFYFHWNKDGSITDERGSISVDVTEFDADTSKWRLN